MSKPQKPYWNMTATELAEATREFDREHVGETFHEMTPAEEKAWRAAVYKRPPRRTARPKGTKKVSVALQAGLLKRVDALAKKRGISRGRLIAESLKAMLSKRGP